MKLPNFGFFSKPEAKPTLTLPSDDSIRLGRSDEIEAACWQAATEISSLNELWVWYRQWPSRSNLCFWNESNGMFISMPLNDFKAYIYKNFDVYPDTYLAARIYGLLAGKNSPLPEASCQLQDKLRIESKKFNCVH